LTVGEEVGECLPELTVRIRLQVRVTLDVVFECAGLAVGTKRGQELDQAAAERGGGVADEEPVAGVGARFWWPWLGLLMGESCGGPGRPTVGYHHGGLKLSW